MGTPTVMARARLRSPGRRSRAALVGTIALAVLAGACGDDSSALTADQQSIEEAVRADVNAENAKDADAFLALWTDDGLASYDQGSREEIASGESHLGADPITLVGIEPAEVDGDTASVISDATIGHSVFAKIVYRVKFLLVKLDGEWKFNGFEFLGSPPAEKGTPVVNVDAVEYAYNVDDTLPGRPFVLNFVNKGTEAHEISLYKAPNGTTALDAKTALENVDGSELTNLPDGYVVDHVAYAEPGESLEVVLAEALAPGTYVLTCYLPAGGSDEETGEPLKADAKPHIQLGMVAVTTVR